MEYKEPQIRQFKKYVYFLLAIFLFSVILLFLYISVREKHTQIKEPFLQTQKHSEISFEYITLRSIADMNTISEVRVPQLQSTHRFNSEINSFLLGIAKEMCMNVTTDRDIQRAYEEYHISTDGAESAVSTQEMLSMLQKSGMHSDIRFETKYQSKHILSILVSREYNCGGPYPDAYLTGYNFLYDGEIDSSRLPKTSEKFQISFFYIFNDYGKNIDRIHQILARAIAKDSDEVCFYGDEKIVLGELNSFVNSEYIRDPISYTLTNTHLIVQSMFLNHATAACEPTGLEIPWSDFESLLNPDFVSKL